MKSIYILLTRSTTICSRIVYMATRSEFTHAAISLDRNFDKLYTFGRKYKRLMLPAGFVRESVYDGLLGDSDDMRCAVYEIKISDISYKRLTNFLSHMEKTRKNIVTAYWVFLCASSTGSMSEKDIFLLTVRLLCAEQIRHHRKDHGTFAGAAHGSVGTVRSQRDLQGENKRT